MTRTIDRLSTKTCRVIITRPFRRMLVGVLLTPLVACFGGGGGGGGSGGNGLVNNPSGSFFNQVAEPAQPFNATDWSIAQEYINSTGLDQLKAAEGYARRTLGQPGGQGIRIAIIDTGIDVTHQDLGNLHSQSWSAGGEALVSDAHGTFVAGIAAASRTQTGDANDMHGLAYGATLVNFQTIRPSTGDTTFASSDLVVAINAAAGLSSGSSAVESDIINLSLGAFSSSDSTFSSLRTAMRAAADEDKIMVLAAGNEGLDADQTRKLQPIFPAAYADDSGIAGHAIAVGNLTSTNQVAASSNHCGDTKDYCLFAPGTNIRSTLNGGGYGIGSGTSFAAPYVTGAAAVVKAAFPGVSSQDVVNRLLLTAQDLGDPGVDDTFGRGLLDLEAAMAPVGPVGLITGASIDDETASLAETSLTLGQAWSIGDQGKALLARAVGFDDLGFPFAIDLNDRIQSTEATSGLQPFISRDQTSSANSVWSGASLAVSIADQEIDRVTDQARSPVSFKQQHRSEIAPQVAFSAEPFDKLSVFTSVNGTSKTKLGLGYALNEAGLALFDNGGALAPFDQLSGPVSGGGIAFGIGGGFEVAISAFTNMSEEENFSQAMQKVELAKDVGSQFELRLGVGLIQQEDGFLGNSTEGAFGDSEGSHARFADLSVVASLTDRIDWFASYSLGQASIEEGSSSFLSDWSSVQADAFATGASFQDVAARGDSVSLMIGQPLRGRRASAALTVPVGRTSDGQVITDQERVDFEPSSREITSNLLYRRPLTADKAAEIALGGFVRFNPDHNAGQAPIVGFGLRYRWSF